MGRFDKNTKSISYRINEEIYGFENVRVVGENIESRVLPLTEAKKLALSLGLDLVEMNTKINPPIMRIANYEKLIYELKKAAKKNKQSNNQLKEIQLSVNIASNDLKIKAKKAREFIEDGDKVKVILSMKGRELSRRDENKRSILEFITLLEDVAVPENMPKDEGNKTIVILKKKG